MILGATILAGIAIWLYVGKNQDEAIVFNIATAKVTNIQNSITATGTIEVVTSVTIGTQVSGIISKLYVDYNTPVKKGQVIAELDKTNLTSNLNTAKAALASAQSALNYQIANFKRYSTLFSKGLVSGDDYDSAKLSYKQAQQ